MKHALLASVFSTLLLFFSVTPTFAQYVAPLTSQPNRQMMIEKKILNPSNNQFVDNLNIDQHTFLPDQDVIFRVSVTNVIQSDLRNLTVIDRLPDVLNFVSTSFGSYDAAQRTITFTIDTLKIGETKTFEVRTKVKPADQLSVNVTCQTNLARVTMNNMVDEDTATFCIQKQVLGAQSALPTTGPENTLPILMLSTILLSIGFLSKRIVFLEES